MLSHEPLTLRYKHREDVEELVVGYARGNLVRGMIDEVDGERVAHLASSLLSDEYRGDGEGRFGSRLYQRFVKEAKAKGAVWLTGDTPSGRAFAVRLRLFGTDNTECFDKHLRSIRIDEAVEKAGYGLKFYARHDLRKVDTTDW